MKYKTLKSMIEIMDEEVAHWLDYSAFIREGISAYSIIDIYANSGNSGEFVANVTEIQEAFSKQLHGVYEIFA